MSSVDENPDYIGMHRSMQNMVLQLLYREWDRFISAIPFAERAKHCMDILIRTNCEGHDIIIKLWSTGNYVHVCSQMDLYGKPLGQWEFQACHDCEWRSGIEKVFRNYDTNIDGFRFDGIRFGKMSEELQELFKKLRRNAEAPFYGRAVEPV